MLHLNTVMSLEIAEPSVTRPNAAKPLSAGEQRALDDIEARLAAEHVEEVIALGTAYTDHVVEELSTRSLVRKLSTEAAQHPNSAPRRMLVDRVRSMHIGARVRRVLKWADLTEARGQTPDERAIQDAYIDAIEESDQLTQLPQATPRVPAPVVWEQDALVNVHTPNVHGMQESQDTQAEVDDTELPKHQDTIPGVDELIQASDRANLEHLRRIYAAGDLHTLDILPDMDAFPTLAHWIATDRGAASEVIEAHRAGEGTNSERMGRALGRLRAPLPQSWHKSRG